MMTKNEALKLEYRIKQLPADKKVSELIKHTIAQDIDAVALEIKTLEKVVAKISNELMMSFKMMEQGRS